MLPNCLDPNINNVTVNTTVYDKNGGAKQIHPYALENVPRWTNIIITINNRALDLYLDGKVIELVPYPEFHDKSSNSC